MSKTFTYTIHKLLTGALQMMATEMLADLLINFFLLKNGLTLPSGLLLSKGVRFIRASSCFSSDKAGSIFTSSYHRATNQPFFLPYINTYNRYMIW
jgi:hypothetical protein